MNVLVLHNRYQQAGGEDAVVRAEIEALGEHGVNVVEASLDNEIEPGRWSERVQLAIESAWSRKSYRDVEDLCRKYRPDIAHVHNFWFRLSPAVHAACQAHAVPTIQTLHNFRLLCANAQLLRNGKVCEDCVGKAPWRGITRRCYRSSYLSSAAVVRMIVANRRRRTWWDEVDAYIVMTEHARSKFVAGGLPGERIFLNPNPVSDCGEPLSLPSTSNTLVYAGRLSPERDIAGLLSAWASAGLGRYGRLLVVGDGPDRANLEQHAQTLKLSPPEVTFAGWLCPQEVRSFIASSRALVLPSHCYEGGGCPVVLIEAYAAARPVIVSDIGGMREIVHQNKTGFKVMPRNRSALASVLQHILTDGEVADTLGRGARLEYLAKFTPDEHCRRLMDIYQFALRRKQATVSNARDN